MEDFVIDAGQSLMLMSVLSVVLFCGCCYQFLRTLTKPVPVLNSTRFAKSALRLEKSYKVFAWGVLMATFLLGLVISFAEVFARL
ncbi:MAG TPA: hypothetical protein PL182_06215 [Pseudobdellovibrionaceae bacterium]|nr:hypothetical protein [Pseudobdellovibrionaceae bacterium]